MKIQTVLYYRYLMRQAITINIVSFFLSLIICLVFLFVRILDYKTSIIIASCIWVFFLFTFVALLVWIVKFKSTKNKLKDLELYKRITNEAIRIKVLKSGIRIKYLIPKSGQEEKFFNAIKSEIEKQKKLILIQKGEYK